MIDSLSILLPTYNCRCVELVTALHSQCEDVSGLHYEIIVADDASTVTHFVEQNRAIASLSHVRYIERRENVGRSRIRNILVGEARHDWLLLIDGDLELDNSDYIQNFLASTGDLVVGGITIGGHHPGNLRWMNEKAHEPQTKAAWRTRHPLELHTNFMVRRQTLLDHPFDERFTRYGYEDVLLGQRLVAAGLRVSHIDNPVLFAHYESNPHFLRKTEDALLTLYDFREQLSACNHLLPFMQRLQRWRLMGLLQLSYKLLNKSLRRRLEGNKPSLFLFKVYRLLLFAHLVKKTTTNNE